MPHIIVKVVAGKTEEQKARLAEGITRDVMLRMDQQKGAISVVVEEVQSADWMETVYQTDILPKWALL